MFKCSVYTGDQLVMQTGSKWQVASAEVPERESELVAKSSG